MNYCMNMNIFQLSVHVDILYSFIPLLTKHVKVQVHRCFALRIYMYCRFYNCWSGSFFFAAAL